MQQLISFPSLHIPMIDCRSLEGWIYTRVSNTSPHIHYCLAYYFDLGLSPYDGPSTPKDVPHNERPSYPSKIGYSISKSMHNGIRDSLLGGREVL